MHLVSSDDESVSRATARTWLFLTFVLSSCALPSVTGPERTDAAAAGTDERSQASKAADAGAPVRQTAGRTAAEAAGAPAAGASPSSAGAAGPSAAPTAGAAAPAMQVAMPPSGACQDNGGCAQRCIEVGASARCDCDPGSYLKSDGKQCETWSVPSSVVEQTGVDVHRHVASIDDSGRVLVVWTQSHAQGGGDAPGDIWFREWTPESGWQTAMPLKSAMATQLSLSGNARGDAVLSWIAPVQGCACGPTWVSRRPSGGVWSAPTQLNAQDSWYTRAAIGPEGDVVVAMLLSDSVRAAMGDISGNWGPDLEVYKTASTGTRITDAVATIDAQHTAHLAFSEAQNGGSETGTLSVVQAKAGSAWNSPRMLGSASVDQFGTPLRSSTDARGGAIIGWSTGTLANCSILSAGQWLQPAPCGNQVDIRAVALAADGEALAASFARPLTDTTLFVRGSMNGSSWDDMQPVGPAHVMSAAGSASIGFDANGNAIMVWDATGIFVSRRARGAGWQEPYRLSPAGNVTSISAQIVINAAGQAAIFWTDFVTLEASFLK